MNNGIPQKTVTMADTVEWMLSVNSRERLRAEYAQTAIRSNRLNALLAKAYAGALEAPLGCPSEVLERQVKAMDVYLECLQKRADVDGIALPEVRE